MLRSGTQLIKSHRDDLGLAYLWDGDECSSLENSLKAMEKMPNMEDNKKSVHVIETTVHYETQTKALYLEKFY